MKVVAINQVETKLKQLKTNFTSHCSVDDAPNTKLVQEAVQAKFLEIEELFLSLRETTNSSGAKVQKWFKENIPQELNEYIKVSANESSFCIGISPLYFNVDITRDEKGIPIKKVEVSSFNSMKHQVGSQGRSIFKEQLKEIDKYITWYNSHGTHKVLSSFLYGRGMCLEFIYYKKIFKDKETTEDIMNFFLTELLSTIAQAKQDLNNGLFDVAPNVKKG